MATAVDWLDAYRAGDIDAILKMYASNARLQCGCGPVKIVSGAEGMRAYWMNRLQNHPASDLDDIQPWNEGMMISYTTRGCVVGAVLSFNAAGQIASHICGPVI